MPGQSIPKRILRKFDRLQPSYFDNAQEDILYTEFNRSNDLSQYCIIEITQDLTLIRLDQERKCL